jgi:hypothetical protein
MQDLSNIYLRLKDAHTVLRKGLAIIAMQPMMIGSVWDTNTMKQSIYFSKQLPGNFSRALLWSKFNLVDYEGATINTIDGTPALEAIATFSKGVYGYYSKSTTFDNNCGIILSRRHH